MLEKRNYEFNKTVAVRKGFINGQAGCSAGKMRFGLRTLSTCGSCVIAVYNLLLMLNRQRPLADISREVYMRSRTPLGLLGANPFRLIRFFSAHYLPVNLDRSFKSFCAKMQPGCGGIAVWWSGRKFLSPIHAVAVENDRGRVLVYNRFAKSGKHYEFKSVAQITSSKKFIVGYCINIDEFYN